jgi:hypothetical protein
MTIQENLNTLIDGKQTVVDSVNDKAGTDLTVESRWLDIANAVDSISGGSGPDIVKLRGRNGGYYLFYETTEDISNPSYLSNCDWSENTTCYCLFGATVAQAGTNIKHAPYFDTTNCTSFGAMFKYARYLETVPEPFYDASNVTTCYEMFHTSVNNNLSNFGLNKTFEITAPKCTSFGSMCSGRFFKKIKVNNTSATTTVGNIAINDPYLEVLDIYTLDGLTNSQGTASMNKGESLKKFILRSATKVPPLNSAAFGSASTPTAYHFLGIVNETYNPTGAKDGRIYVPDNMVDSFKTATNWSKYADIIVPLSTLQED